MEHYFHNSISGSMIRRYTTVHVRVHYYESIIKTTYTYSRSTKVQYFRKYFRTFQYVYLRKYESTSYCTVQPLNYLFCLRVQHFRTVRVQLSTYFRKYVYNCARTSNIALKSGRSPFDESQKLASCAVARPPES